MTGAMRRCNNVMCPLRRVATLIDLWMRPLQVFNCCPRAQVEEDRNASGVHKSSIPRAAGSTRVTL